MGLFSLWSLGSVSMYVRVCVKGNVHDNGVNKVKYDILITHSQFMCGERSCADWLPCITHVDATHL